MTHDRFPTDLQVRHREPWFDHWSDYALLWTSLSFLLAAVWRSGLLRAWLLGTP